KPVDGGIVLPLQGGIHQGGVVQPGPAAGKGRHGIHLRKLGLFSLFYHVLGKWDVKFSECPSKAAGVWYNKRKAGKNDPGRKREPMLKMNRPDAEQSALSLEKRFETTLTAALKAIH